VLVQVQRPDVAAICHGVKVALYFAGGCIILFETRDSLGGAGRALAHAGLR
jgi:hypothetical protein